MAFRRLVLKPGVNLEASPTAGALQIFSANLIRFYGGLAQKLGGWLQLSQQTYTGTCRGLHGWSDIVGVPYIGIGTEQRLQVYASGQINDITPIVATDNPAVAFSTVISTPNVTVTDAAYTPTAGDWTYQATHIAVGGLILNGYYQVQSVTDATHYVIAAGSNATGTVVNGGAVAQYTTANTSAVVTVTLPAHGLVTGDVYTPGVSFTAATITVAVGTNYSVTVVDANSFTITVAGTANANSGPTGENSGNARIQYLLPSGPVVDTAATGYGSGGYGLGSYGVGSTSNVITALRQWSLDHFGQDLIASPLNGKIYFWQPPTIAPAAVVDATAPTMNTAVFVFPQAEIIMALGAETGGTQEPLLARWCDAGDFTDWTASAVNQAGSYSFPSGSKLIGGLATGLGATVWTDKDVWSVTYLGFPLVFGFNRIATECGMVAMRAAGCAGTLVMWLDSHQYYRYNIGGGVTPVECPVWDFYWYNTDQTQLGQYHCAVNTNFNEMAWFFPLATTSPLYNPLTPLGYIKFNYVENCWDYGLSSQYQVTAWFDHSPLGSPVSAMTGTLMQHEVTNDANGQALLWSWQAAYWDMAEGEDIQFSDMLIPDWVTNGTSPSFVPNLLVTDAPELTPTQVFVQNFGSGTYQISYSARGRYLSVGFQASPSDVGTFWRLGSIRARVQPDGKF